MSDGEVARGVVLARGEGEVKATIDHVALALGPSCMDGELAATLAGI